MKKTPPILLITILLAGCDYSISSGDLNGLTIGSTIDQVFAELEKQGVKQIEPLPDSDKIVTQENIKDIEKLGMNQGVCISNSRGYDLKIKFSSLGPEVNYSSPQAESDRKLLQGAKAREDIHDAIRKILDSNKKAVASNCIVPSMKFNTASRDQGIKEYSRLTFHIPESYSTMTLYFNNETLQEAEYHWRPFELP